MVGRFLSSLLLLLIVIVESFRNAFLESDAIPQLLEMLKGNDIRVRSTAVKFLRAFAQAHGESPFY